MNRKNYKIAIDGPSGSGKSTLAKNLALKLGFVYVDTGAMYRTVGLYVCRKGVSKDDSDGITWVLPEIDMHLDYIDGVQHVFLNDEDVSCDIRLPHISEYASAVSKIPAVRALLTPVQRRFGEHHSIIMDGRDIGTVVFPDADVKIFLSAPVEERARRRFEELSERGTPEPYEKVLEEMKIRDERDASRDIAPSKPADDAFILDNSGFTSEKTFNTVLSIIKEKIGLE